MPEWEAVVTIFFLSIVVIITAIGNILVIISVLTYAPLKITPNYFIISLAVADLTVSVCVLPFSLVSTVLGRWVSSCEQSARHRSATKLTRALFMRVVAKRFARRYSGCVHLCFVGRRAGVQLRS